jgi:DNA-binding NtrC family response regulator
MPRILLIEDESDARVMMEHVLLDAGYAVDTSITVAHAGELFETYAYDLVIADARLHDGWGTRVAENALDRGVPALVITGYAFALHNEDARFDPLRYPVLLKPARPHELLAAVARALNAAQADRGR